MKAASSLAWADLLTVLHQPREADPAARDLPAKLRGLPVTFASMITTDGRTTHVGVYRGLMIGRKGKRFINCNARTTVHVATVRIEGDADHCATVARLQAEYGTPCWPAVDWNL